jgi:PKD repeat protein
MRKPYRHAIAVLCFALLCVGVAGCLVVTNLRPEATFTATPTSGTSPLHVAFDASASVDPDGTIVAYLWDFGDGQTASAVAITTHDFLTQSVSRVFTVVLVVTDNLGATDTAVRNISVTPPP